MEVHHHPKARQSGKGKNKIEPYEKNNFIHAHIA